MAERRIERTVDMAKRIGWMKGIVAALITAVAWNALPVVTFAASDQTEAPYSQVIERWHAEGRQEIENALYVIDPAGFSESGAWLQRIPLATAGMPYAWTRGIRCG